MVTKFVLRTIQESIKINIYLAFFSIIKLDLTKLLLLDMKDKILVQLLLEHWLPTIHLSYQNLT